MDGGTVRARLRGVRRAVVLALALGAGMAVPAAPASAAFDIFDVGGALTTGGVANLQAGDHPDVRVRFRLPATTRNGSPVPDGAAKTVDVVLPPGLVGNPNGLATCTRRQLTENAGGTSPNCPIASQVGKVFVQLGPDPETFYALPVFNMVRPDDSPGLFAFNFFSTVVQIVPAVRGSDYRVNVSSQEISQAKAVYGIDMTMWGIPADPVHDADRWNSTLYGGYGDWGAASAAERQAFLTSPTSCNTTPASFDVSGYSWQEPGRTVATAFSTDMSSNPFIMTGCDRLAFAPEVEVAPTVARPNATTGLNVDLVVPQNDGPDGLATAHVRNVEMALPEGVSVSPSSAAGLQACSPAQIGIGTERAPDCPGASKLGTVQVDTPLLDESLAGDIYLATPYQNAFGSLLSIYIVASGAGVTVKLPGRIDADPATGRLTATFINNPQLPFNRLRVRFDSGPQAALSTPAACGRYTARTTLTSWASDRPVVVDSPVVIDQGCGPGASRPLAPSFRAGTQNVVAGAGGTFALAVGREDQTQELKGLEAIRLPAGLLGRVGSVALCGEADAAQGTCPGASRVGHVQIAAGVGSAPLWVPEAGKSPTSVSLTGPYKGAPFGLSIVVPAQAGPLDLGKVVVRSALHVDKRTAQLSTGVDESRIYNADGSLERTIVGEMPTILKGIPLQLKELRVVVDREGFMVNPTDCTARQITADIVGVQGQRAAVSSPFQVGECAALTFVPKLSLRVGSGGRKAAVPAEMKDGGHPGLTARLSMPTGQANNKKAVVALPLSLALDPDNANGLCEPSDAVAEKCPEKSIVGSAEAVSPLLQGKVSGPVYFVRGERTDPKSGRIIKTLPKLFIPLTASAYPGLQINLYANSEVRDDRLVTTFDNLPDVPISTFDLTINGGRHGILVVSNTNMCNATQQADSELGGQNGAVARLKTPFATSCGLAVRSSSRSGATLKVAVAGVGAGKVSVSGKGLTKATRRLQESTTVTVAAPIKKAVRAALARGRNVAIKVTVAYTPTGAKKATKATKTITIHGAKS